MTMQFPDTLPSWYAHQLYRHEQLIALFESRKSGQTMERLQDWLIHQDYDTDPRFAEMTKELRRHITELVLALDRSATPAQRRYFLAKLDDLTALVRRLQAAWCAWCLLFGGWDHRATYQNQLGCQGRVRDWASVNSTSIASTSDAGMRRS